MRGSADDVAQYWHLDEGVGGSFTVCVALSDVAAADVPMESSAGGAARCLANSVPSLVPWAHTGCDCADDAAAPRLAQQQLHAAARAHN